MSAAAKGDQLLMERTLGGQYGEYTKEDVSDALLRAACLGNRSCVSRLLAHGADPDCEDFDGDTPLMLAATNNHVGNYTITTEKTFTISKYCMRLVHYLGTNFITNIHKIRHPRKRKLLAIAYSIVWHFRKCLL